MWVGWGVEGVFWSPTPFSRKAGITQLPATPQKQSHAYKARAPSAHRGRRGVRWFPALRRGGPGESAGMCLKLLLGREYDLETRKPV